ncbi:protein FATTY ACID EXPORT 3, chloroplastic [Sesamum angolense]|uniref:Protein FATTY ACID EXPORT 3, chloroplastic n=1 Tax=Sesamum angolense TaxID=2727404 RepID=A0AAE1WMN6_9LAMI|nr:protein FATTY ACID EXPORT 3, chloroplastic [Sesamum angolense]
MTITLESITFRNPTPRFHTPSLTPPPSLTFHPFSTPPNLSIPLPPRLLSLNLRPTSLRTRSVFSFAASHEESKAADIDLEKEKEDLKVGAQESQEAWQQTLAAFKEQALKTQAISKEAYELYSEKAIVVLKETSEKLKIQAEKARQDLSVIAKEIVEESKEYLATAAETSPEPVKDIVETFASSPGDLNDVSKVRDFYVGIPYGALLSVGGFLSFMLTGSIPAIRFGIILGGTLLALSISSLRSWKKGEPSPLVLKGQSAIVTILFLRELRLLSVRPFVANFITTFISGGVAAFYLYRIITEREQQSGGSNLATGPEN